LEAPSQVATLKQRFGKKLRAIRLERRLTQEQFAEALDISVDFLSLIERGRNAPSFETLDNIAKRLRLPVSELFSFEPR
jgi:transcriptional regulator with XRE-family HTH domain